MAICWTKYFIFDEHAPTQSKRRIREKKQTTTNRLFLLGCNGTFRLACLDVLPSPSKAVLIDICLTECLNVPRVEQSLGWSVCARCVLHAGLRVCVALSCLCATLLVYSPLAARP